MTGVDPHKILEIANAVANSFVIEGGDIYNARIELIKKQIKELVKEKIEVDELIRKFSSQERVNPKLTKDILAKNYGDIYNARIELLKKQIKELVKEKIEVDELIRKFSSQERVNPKSTKDILAIHVYIYDLLIDKIFFLKDKMSNSKNYEIIKPAILPAAPIRPNKKLIIVIAVNIGLILVIFIAFMQDYIKHKKKSKSGSYDPERF
ncbi:MAG: hypothetical protein KKA52_02515 [Candidatus Omnitrophica bacterium]|nr:hypothetical protein [Candidatus Omnitrophota bacterium]